MGWNQLKVKRDSPLTHGLEAHSHVYFVHSYYCAPDERQDIVALVDYGIEFAAAVQKDNIYGVQFHPEKSQRVGLQLLENFLRL